MGAVLSLFVASSERFIVFAVCSLYLGRKPIVKYIVRFTLCFVICVYAIRDYALSPHLLFCNRCHRFLCLRTECFVVRRFVFYVNVCVISCVSSPVRGWVVQIYGS